MKTDRCFLHFRKNPVWGKAGWKDADFVEVSENDGNASPIHDEKLRNFPSIRFSPSAL